MKSNDKKSTMRGEKMDNKENTENETPKASTKGHHVHRQPERYTGENVRAPRKLNESQTKALSSGGKKQRQKSKLAPRG